MSGLTLTTDQIREIESAMAEFSGASEEVLLDRAFPSLRDAALGGMLAGGKPSEVVAEWVKNGFRATLHQAGAAGEKVMTALREAEPAHKVYLTSILVAFLFHHAGMNDIPIKELTAAALLIAAVTDRQRPKGKDAKA